MSALRVEEAVFSEAAGRSGDGGGYRAYRRQSLSERRGAGQTYMGQMCKVMLLHAPEGSTAKVASSLCTRRGVLRAADRALMTPAAERWCRGAQASRAVQQESGRLLFANIPGRSAISWL